MSDHFYQSSFIGDGIQVKEPGFSTELAGAVFRDDQLRDGIFLDFEHYSVVMNKTTRQLIYAASNIDQTQHIQVRREASKGWDTDSRVPEMLQLDNRYYKSNDWDRGHMVQRENNCWGNDYQSTLKANNDTFFYTNAAFQHKFFNQDEWLKLERFVGSLDADSNGKLCIFTGPIHLQFDRQYARNWHDSVRVPSAFFKIVCYRSQASQKMETRAFMLFQDEEFIDNKKSGAAKIQLKNYQVTVAEIENLTGLEFGDQIAASNPLFFNEPDDSGDATVNAFPERIPVETQDDIVNDIRAPRSTQEAKAADKAIVITAAMVNPENRDKIVDEWISLLNISGEDVNIDGWSLQNSSGATLQLNGIITPGNVQKVPMNYGFRLLNSGGTIILKNTHGEVIDREVYTRIQASIQDWAVRF